MAGMTDALARTARAVAEDLFSVPEARAIETALLCLAAHPEVVALAPGAREAAGVYRALPGDARGVEREAVLLDVYLALHRAGGVYGPEEEARLRAIGGCPWQPGGLLPLVLASRMIDGRAAVADLGAGNGLQGLILQAIRPHRLTLQVELGGAMVRAGRVLQRALPPGRGRMRWLHADLREADLSEIDLVYLYRPCRPHGEGLALYRELAARLVRRAGRDRPFSVVSVADCLAPLVAHALPVVFQDEFLVCMRSRAR